MKTNDVMETGTHSEKRTANHFMNRDTPIFKKETPCDALLSEMLTGQFSRLPIVDDQYRLIGIVDQGDLLKMALKRGSLKQMCAAEMMKESFFILTHCPSFQVARALRDNHLHDVPVVDHENHVMGMITAKSVFRQNRFNNHPIERNRHDYST